VKTAAVLTRVWLDLTDEQAAALLREPNDVIERPIPAVAANPRAPWHPREIPKLSQAGPREKPSGDNRGLIAPPLQPDLAALI
jgi:hypothetical protein